MPVHENRELQRDAYVSSDEILRRVAEIGDLQPTQGPGGNGPARYYTYPGSAGSNRR